MLFAASAVRVKTILSGRTVALLWRRALGHLQRDFTHGSMDLSLPGEEKKRLRLTDGGEVERNRLLLAPSAAAHRARSRVLPWLRYGVRAVHAPFPVSILIQEHGSLLNLKFLR